MSENETRGRCRVEMDAFHGGLQMSVLADAIDRIAADVAAVKEAVCDGSVAEERDRFLSGWGAAIRERDEARDEVERLDGEVRDRDARIDELIAGQTTAIRERDEVRAEAERLRADLIDALLARAELDEARAEAERRRMQLAVCAVLADSNTTESLERSRRVHPDYDCDAVQSVIRAVEREIALRADAERLRAELAEARAETQRIQDEADDREEKERVKRLNAEIEKTHRTLLNRTWERDRFGAEVERLRGELAARPAAAGWLTDAERQALLYFRTILLSRRDAPNHLECVDAILDRAGSPPVVEVPVMPAVVVHRLIHIRYRAALDAAGIQWKEEPRE